MARADPSLSALSALCGYCSSRRVYNMSYRYRPYRAVRLSPGAHGGALSKRLIHCGEREPLAPEQPR